MSNKEIEAAFEDALIRGKTERFDLFEEGIAYGLKNEQGVKGFVRINKKYWEEITKFLKTLSFKSCFKAGQEQWKVGCDCDSCKARKLLGDLEVKT